MKFLLQFINHRSNMILLNIISYDRQLLILRSDGKMRSRWKQKSMHFHQPKTAPSFQVILQNYSTNIAYAHFNVRKPFKLQKITQIGKYPSTQALWLSGNNISYPPWIRATEQMFVLQVALSYVRHQNLISIDYYQQSFLTYYILKAPNRCLFTSIFIRHFQVVHRDLKPHKHKHFSTTQSVITSTYKTISTFRGHIFFHKCILFDKQNRSQLTST